MKNSKPYIIAEFGVNFYDTAKIMDITPLEAAKLYIDRASEVGIDCAKFQAYKANTIASKNSPAYWDQTKEPTDSQYKLFTKFDAFDENDYKELAKYAHQKGMDFTATPFDYKSADFLYDMVDFYKIASADLTNLPFLEYIAKKGKRMMVSVGASYLSEVDEAVRVILNAGISEDDITLLHCVLSYPTAPENANLRVIDTLKRDFSRLHIGFSDHVAPDSSMMTLAVAYMEGAEVIEKHFTLDKSIIGNDHYHAGEPEDFAKAIANFKWIDTVLGSNDKTVFDCEQIPRKQARRSLVLARDMKEGEVIHKEDIIPKRPGTGISPKYTDLVVGRKIKRNLAEDTILDWDMI